MVKHQIKRFFVNCMKKLAHSGKVVVCLEYGLALGALGWHTFPGLRNAYNNLIFWDDRDLTPLGDEADTAQVANELEHA